MRCTFVSLLTLLFVGALGADGPKDNLSDNVRPVPPPGIKIAAEDREALEKGLETLRAAIDHVDVQAPREFRELLPDVEIYYKAVHDALHYNEFYNQKEIAVAKNLLKTGLARAQALAEGKHPWTTQTGFVVRGYRSKIDRSVQPFGLVIPKSFDFSKKIRLDFWCHGRGENLTELNFIQSCQSSGGPFASEKAIVLNLYGRYCCANKLAGEVDCFEALDAVKKHYPIDEDRLVMRGFSMGGAACWQFAVHYPSVWCAAAPGAGFAETPEFLKVFQNESVSPTWYEKKLWHMYDCTDYALNIFNLPTVAYSGEIDSQKQAADIMAKAMKGEGLELVHIIGPKTGHGYEKGAKALLIEQIDKIADKGRSVPKEIKFVTYTLRYNKCSWIVVEGLDQHWERAQIEAQIAGKNEIKVTTKNVSRFRITIPEQTVLGADQKIALTIDGQKVGMSLHTEPRGSFWFHAEKTGGQWVDVHEAPKRDYGLEKVPGLQGPIDDAFLDSFLMVFPSGKPLNDKTGEFFDAESKHAIAHWRKQFRGEAPQKSDKDVTQEDIVNSNLILWGDPSSNSILNKIAGKLPITWKDGKIVVGEESFDGATHVPLLIYPNPLNPKRYVVLNSGFTFREYDYLNNARQVPKLPDFAIVDVTTPPSPRYPGKVVAAGFFDEKWGLPPKK